MSRRRFLQTSLLAGAGVATGVFEGGARALAQGKAPAIGRPPFRILMGGYGPPNTSFSLALKQIGDRLTAKFGKDVDVKYVYNIIDLGYKGEDILWLVENGVLTAGYQSSSYLTDRVPEADAITSAGNADELVAEGGRHAALAEELGVGDEAGRDRVRGDPLRPEPRRERRGLRRHHGRMRAERSGAGQIALDKRGEHFVAQQAQCALERGLGLHGRGVEQFGKARRQPGSVDGAGGGAGRTRFPARCPARGPFGPVQVGRQRLGGPCGCA